MGIHLEAWHIWLLVGIILFIVEIFTPSFVAGSLGVGAILTTFVPLFLGWGINGQLITFGVFSIVSFFAIRPIFLKYLDKTTTETNVDALVGQMGTVVETIDAGAYGYVKIDGDRWRATTEDKSVKIETGAVVKVVKMEGNTIFVEPISN